MHARKTSAESQCQRFPGTKGLGLYVLMFQPKSFIVALFVLYVCLKPVVYFQLSNTPCSVFPFIGKYRGRISPLSSETIKWISLYEAYSTTNATIYAYRILNPYVHRAQINGIYPHAQVILSSEGFSGAKDLASKIVSMFTLSKQLLSRQQHYDWGLRALKAVLNTGGKLIQVCCIICTGVFLVVVREEVLCVCLFQWRRGGRARTSRNN